MQQFWVLSYELAAESIFGSTSREEQIQDHRVSGGYSLLGYVRVKGPEKQRRLEDGLS